MIADAFAHIHANGRLGTVTCAPPLTLRAVRGEPDECTLCLVGTAAGPLAGDALRLHLQVDAGARARLLATGAQLAQGRDGVAATVAMSADVDGRLVADPGPLVVAGGGHVDVGVTLALGPDAHVQWHELVVLGRTHDTVQGRATLRWDVTRAGRAVLRQEVEARDVGHRVMASVLVSGPDVPARTVVAAPTAVAQRVDPQTVLITVLGADAATVQGQMGRLLAEVLAGSALGTCGDTLTPAPPAASAR